MFKIVYCLMLIYIISPIHDQHTGGKISKFSYPFYVLAGFAAIVKAFILEALNRFDRWQRMV